MPSTFFCLLKEDDKGATLRALQKQEPGDLPEHPTPLLGRGRFLRRL
jgi:hypothetical protein